MKNPFEDLSNLLINNISTNVIDGISERVTEDIASRMPDLISEALQAKRSDERVRKVDIYSEGNNEKIIPLGKSAATNG